MKRAIKTKAKRGSARDLFAELSEGMEVIQASFRRSEVPHSHMQPMTYLLVTVLIDYVFFPHHFNSLIQIFLETRINC